MSEENIPSENSKKEILNSKQEEVTKNISQQETIQQTENMEVHNHPHVEKKNFKEYFSEFLMIFLAVTLGFFAENIREHFVNREKEKNYMEGILQDLEKGTAAISYDIGFKNLIVKELNNFIHSPRCWRKRPLVPL